MPRYTSLHANLTLLVVIAGIAAVVQDSLAKSAPASYLNLHALFGALLWASVVARFHRRLHQSPRMLPIDIREFSRHLSRLVYLMLYILMLVSLIIGAVDGIWRNRWPAAPDFRGYLGYGLIALVTIQVLGDVAGRSMNTFNETDGSDSTSRPVQNAMGDPPLWRFQFLDRSRRWPPPPPPLS
jgi:hypothetical protein